ncbi:MAG: tRNA (adenosine(37)-N6)-dimethylallyltransferase MiaA [Muribaculaceae bacterium]|nr:tRNA (adenosine(37)-N6)-dimethylallyltransferase MiaA [Muribaculaceae bacterium]
MAIETIAVVGPTASGKTKRAVSLAKAFDGEIISADSRQVYRDMTLGTGKDLEEYEEVKFHLIDICEAGEKYNLHRYLRDFNKVYTDIRERGRFPIICGGSGMYVENALNGIRMPEVPTNELLRKELEKYNLSELTQILSGYKNLHNTTDVDTLKRALRAIEIAEYYRRHPEEAETARKSSAQPLKALVIGLDIPRDLRRASITQRLRDRLEAGMIDEVRNILKNGVKPEDLIYYGLEYKFLTLYVTGYLSYEEMFSGLETAIHQFAKRQMTWFRGMEKRGIKIHWLPFDMTESEFQEEIKMMMQKEDFR